jgi:hypothetical protein
MQAQATGTGKGTAAARWADLVRAMGSEREAAQAMDWEIAKRTAAQRLAQKGTRRNPTDREIERILQAM